MQVKLMKLCNLEDRFEEAFRQALEELLDTGEYRYEEAVQLALDAADEAVDDVEEAAVRY